MGMHDTTAGEEATKRLREAQKGVRSLQEWLAIMDKEIDRHERDNPGLGFSIHWASEMMTKALGIYNEIARCNGAVLVRATKPETAIVCRPNGTRCNICGHAFPDGETCCVNGHEAGKEYESRLETSY